MSNPTKVILRNAREQDIPAVAAIAAEDSAHSGNIEKPETFQRRLTAFPNGFLVLIAGNEIAGYGCSEKWLVERDPSPGENALVTHQPDGRIFCITAQGVKNTARGRGYRLLLLDKLIETAHLEGCRKILVETSHAQDLYLQRGFQTVKNRTERGISLDVLSLDLKPIRMIE